MVSFLAVELQPSLYISLSTILEKAICLFFLASGKRVYLLHYFWEGSGGDSGIDVNLIPGSLFVGLGYP